MQKHPAHHFVWSKQLRTIKTIVYNDIFTSLRRKKVQSPAKQFKELFSPVCYFFALNLIKIELDKFNLILNCMELN